VVRQEIKDGKPEISGQFTLDEARSLARNLNLGALPIPIQLISTQTIGAALGDDALARGVHAGLIGIIAVALFMIVWYRLPGFIAVLALGIYIVIMLAIFRFLPVTLTAAGIAGFILSVGMAVDANILIFERLKEEMKKTSNLEEAINHGFSRAWLSIRDSNLSSIISAIILFWFGTSLVKGFALTLLLGVLVSMLSAITITRTLLRALGAKQVSRANKFLFSSGIFH
jgi:protein-export membrane protein SecD